MTFKELELIDPIAKAIEVKGYITPTPIQEQSIPILLAGNDLLGCAQTGTGKTAAFAIPILQQLYNKIDKRQGRRKVNALVLTPTRELAIQIDDSFTHYGKYTGLRNTVIFGGVKQTAQVNALRGGVDILVATPGRLLDLMNQGIVSLNHIEHFVLDEADHMFDMGFIHDIKKIIAKLPEKRQSLLFSATMPLEIARLAEKMLGSYQRVTINPQQTTAERVDQQAYYVTKPNKPKLLHHLLSEDSYETTLVFSRTKHGADKIVRGLKKQGIKADAIHGNKSQVQRQKALAGFKASKINVLVATDIAARGIDVSGLSLVVNYDLPNVPETYIHRIGRTGRAEASGMAISFCDREERAYLRDIQKLIGQRIPVEDNHPFVTVTEEPVVETSPDASKRYKTNTPPNRPKSSTKNFNRNRRKSNSAGNGNNYSRSYTNNTAKSKR